MVPGGVKDALTDLTKGLVGRMTKKSDEQPALWQGEWPGGRPRLALNDMKRPSKEGPVSGRDESVIGGAGGNRKTP